MREGELDKIESRYGVMRKIDLIFARGGWVYCGYSSGNYYVYISALVICISLGFESLIFGELPEKFK